MSAAPQAVLDQHQCCPCCGRDFGGDEGADAQPGQPCPATDECPSHWEERGIPHPDHPQPVSLTGGAEPCDVCGCWPCAHTDPESWSFA